MRRNIFSIAALFFVCLFTNCEQLSSSDDPSNSMAFSDIKYVDKFLHTFVLQNKKIPNIDIIGMKSFAIYDSLLVFSTGNDNGLWSFISLKTEKELGRFLTRGQGPFQFIEPPSVGNKIKFSTESDSIIAYIYDSQKGKLLRMNIDEALKSKKSIISVAKDSLPPFLFNFIVIDSTTFFCKEVNSSQTQQTRYIINPIAKTIPDVFKPLNNAEIRNGEDINILSTIAKRNEKANRIVEMPIGLKYINIYSLDGTFSRTINIGKRLDNIANIQDRDRWDRLYTFADLRVFDDFFGVVYINEDEKTYQIKRQRLPSILLFDWEGNPIAELKLTHHITSFDIDLSHGELYTFDVHSDELFKYDVMDFLKKI